MSINMMKQDLIDSIKLTRSILIRDFHTKCYFRTKEQPIEYYNGIPFTSEEDEHELFWIFSRVGTKIKLRVNTNDILPKYEQCSPYEALSSCYPLTKLEPTWPILEKTLG